MDVHPYYVPQGLRPFPAGVGVRTGTKPKFPSRPGSVLMRKSYYILRQCSVLAWCWFKILPKGRQVGFREQVPLPAAQWHDFYRL